MTPDHLLLVGLAVGLPVVGSVLGLVVGEMVGSSWRWKVKQRNAYDVLDFNEMCCLCNIDI